VLANFDRNENVYPKWWREMIYKNKINHLMLKGRGLLLVLVLGSVLLNASIADAKAQRVRKSPSSKTLRSMARIYMAYGEYGKAQPLAEQALTLARKTKAADSELAMCLIDLAVLYKGQGKLNDAEEMCELGLKLQEKVLYKKHPYVAYTWRILSSIYQEQGRYDQARSALDKAMAIMLDSHSPDDRVMGPFHVDIAKLLVARGDLEKAESHYQKAMVVINESYGPEHLYTANVLGSIAELYTLQGRYAEAEELIDRAVATQEKIYGSDHHFIAASWLTKAKVCQAKGQHIQSEKLIEKALSAVRKTGNMKRFVRIERRAEEIRVDRRVGLGPIAKATE